MTTPTPPPDFAELRRLKERASPLPWFFNSYSCIKSQPLSRALQAFVDAIPDDAPNSAYSGAVVSDVCFVPVQCGDTATEQGARDAWFIEAACNAVIPLLDALAEAQRERDAQSQHAAELGLHLDGLKERALSAERERDAHKLAYDHHLAGCEVERQILESAGMVDDSGDLWAGVWRNARAEVAERERDALRAEVENLRLCVDISVAAGVDLSKRLGRR